MIFSYNLFDMEKAKWLGNERGDKNHKGAAMSLASKDFNNIKQDVPSHTQLDNLGKLLKQDVVYAPVNFDNGKRSIANAILELDMLIFDIDDGLKLQDVFKINKKLMVLTTTSHSVDKHKFRVFVPLSNKISFETAEHYKSFIGLVGAELFNNKEDKACNEPGRGFIGHKNSSYKVNKSEDIYDPTLVYNLSKIQLELQEMKLKQVQSTNTTEFKQITCGSIKTAKNQEYLDNIQDGSYSNGITSIIGYYKKCKCEKQDIIDFLTARFPEALGRGHNIKKMTDRLF